MIAGPGYGGGALGLSESFACLLPEFCGALGRGVISHRVLAHAQRQRQRRPRLSRGQPQAGQPDHSLCRQPIHLPINRRAPGLAKQFLRLTGIAAGRGAFAEKDLRQNDVPANDNVSEYLHAVVEVSFRFVNSASVCPWKAKPSAATLDMRGARHVMDLGGGSGVVALALLRRHPELSAIVVDHPHVCAAGREIAATRPEGERIVYQAGDFLHDELPAGCDVALLCDVGIFSETLFRKVWCALEPGGRLVIVDDLESPQRKPSVAYRRYAFYQSMTLYAPTTIRPPISRVQLLLARAGFRLSVEKSLSDGDTMILGQK